MTYFRGREELMRRIEELEAKLRAEQEENGLLRRLLFMQYEKQPPAAEKLEFSISTGATRLFEALPQAFTLEDAFGVAERLGASAEGAARHIRSYQAEEMVVLRADDSRFVKTGRKPYF